uniref:glycerophosphodiester phosphodiesterase family protein n=1 Tax=Acetatifactor sp. TaxID=1872090 RepID=UPI004056F08F
MNTIIILLISVLLIVCFYLVAIMPQMMHKSDKTGFMNRLYAHRGLHDNKTDAPENSMRAFQKAVEAGFGIEMDIQLTKDKIPVVFHDFTLKRICGGEGKVSDYTYAELQQFHLCESDQRIPKFEDVLKLVDGKVPLIVEFKIEWNDLSLCPIADKLLRQYKGLYCMESFNPLCVWWYRKNHKEIMRGQLSEAYLKGNTYTGPLYFALQNLLFNFLTKPDFVAYNHKHADNLSRRLCRGLFGNLAVAWTIKNETEMAEAKNHFDLFIFDSFLPEARFPR